MKRIDILSRQMFFRLMKNSNITKENAETLMDRGIFIISINDPTGWNNEQDMFDKDLSNVLTMTFADIRIDVEDKMLKQHGYKFKVFDYDDAYKIKSFIEKIKEKHKDNFYLIIHCHAGVSRSGSVGLYAWLNLGLGTEEEFIKAYPYTSYNPVIFKKLKEISK